MTHHVGEHTPTLPFALPEPGLVRAGMLLRRAGQIGPPALGYGAPPDDVLAAHHCGREQLVLQIAVQQACILDKRQHFARLGERAGERLFAGDRAQRRAGRRQTMDLAHNVEVGVVRRQQPERIDLARHRHRFDAVEHMGLPKAETARLFRDARAPLDRAAVDAADADVAHADHGLQMEGGDEAAADEADAQHREFRELLHVRDLSFNGARRRAARQVIWVALCAAGRGWRPAAPEYRDVPAPRTARRAAVSCYGRPPPASVPGELHATDLKNHPSMSAVPQPGQMRRYAELRGYWD